MNKKFLRNVGWLASTQGLQLLFPLITIPYLTRTLLIAGYGTMVYVVAMGMLLSIVCDYGFNWTGVQETSAHRDDRDALSRIVSNILAAKMVIYLACCVVFCALLLILPQLREHPGLYALTLVVASASACNVNWFLQGIERMAYLAFISVAVRGLGILLMFVFIRGPDDVPIAIVLTSLPGLLVNGLMLIKIRTWISGYSVPTPRETLHQLRLGWTVFSSTLVISAYTQALVLLVGSVGGVVAAAHYGLAERLLNLGKTGIAVSYQAAMPQAAYLARHRPSEGLTFIWRHLLFTAPIGLLGSVIMLFFGEPIIGLIAPPEFLHGAVPVLRILSPVPAMLGISSSLTALYMMNYGLRRQWSWMLMAGCALALSTFGALQSFLPAAEAAAWASVAAEGTVLVVSMWFYVQGRRRVGHGEYAATAANFASSGQSSAYQPACRSGDWSPADVP
jgi:PST family polysaccharide transporter